MLGRSEYILLLAVVPHLARESRAAYIATIPWLPFSLDVAQVLPVTIAIVSARIFCPYDVIIDGRLENLGGLCCREKSCRELQ